MGNISILFSTGAGLVIGTVKVEEDELFLLFCKEGAGGEVGELVVVIVGDLGKESKESRIGEGEGIIGGRGGVVSFIGCDCVA